MAKTIAEINEKIRNGTVVAVTKEEMLAIVAEKGVKKAAEHVDVVTTGTFGPMCSSMAVFNIGHPKPKIKISKAWLNDVECYCGLAAVDMIVGATELAKGDPANMQELAKGDPANMQGPGSFSYGGAHVIEDLVAGKTLTLNAQGYGTDCYPRRELRTLITLFRSQKYELTMLMKVHITQLQ